MATLPARKGTPILTGLKREPAPADEQTVDHRSQRIELETARYKITGVVTLPRDGYRSRLSDMLNAAERDFLALTAATLEPLDGSAPASTYEFLAVHRDHIVFVVPAGPAAAAAEVQPAA